MQMVVDQEEEALDKLVKSMYLYVNLFDRMFVRTNISENGKFIQLIHFPKGST